MKGTLKSTQQITWLFENGSKFSSAGFLALSGVIPTQKKGSAPCRGRTAFVAGKKLGPAPLRNKAKRRLREAVAEAGVDWGLQDVVLVARKGALTKEFSSLIADLQKLEAQLQTPINAEDSTESRTRVRRQRSEEAGVTLSKKEAVQRFVVRLPRQGALLCVKFYRAALSPLFPPSCRYVPSCSEYALIAIERFGFLKGSWMAIKRIGRCHPFVEGGYDPVPEHSEKCEHASMLANISANNGKHRHRENGRHIGRMGSI